MPYLYEAEIAVSRARILESLGFSEESELALSQAEDLAIEAARFYGDRGEYKAMSFPVSAEIGYVWDHHLSNHLRYFEWEQQEEAQIAHFSAHYPPSDVERNLYCPHGHEIFRSKAGWVPCGSCGAPMTPDAEDRYYGALVAAGQCQ